MKTHGIVMDHLREERLGFDEAIYAAGKSVAQVDALAQDAIESRSRRLFTRLDPDKFAALAPAHRAALDYDPVSRTAILGAARQPAGEAAVAVITGGSSDVPVSGEAVRTLAYYGQASLHMPDIGVAGLWRLLARMEELRRMRVVIVVAGMEGALPSVVAGLVPGAIIALPTSVGYGVSEGGRAALTSALASCAPGLVAVNIDNGYGAACAALRIIGVRPQSI
jgi:pyridinium-3,5-biscarboxylic acid mononucleotide synthase